MPSIPVYRPNLSSRTSSTSNPLPHLLQTPSGLAILELQGTIHVPPLSSSSEDLTAIDISLDKQLETPVGKLMFPSYSSSNPPEDTSWMKHVYLYVGKHQRLTGEVKKLPKAIGIVRRRVGVGENGGGGGEDLEIVEIVKYKVVFSQRPEPVGSE
ncbi:hypothetical protein EJ08DRAFT_415301 [Tothia fuscella]|uniref:Chromosome transmission fidelity protein 8 n=1 Tax=Tothia fuscella TaxID=1048955 RepID=A0A9P4NK08_9PEZI|nr:hypothetical protein EJ08DRAFT_415301 [Tothia fuscella]